jgi:radical SAM superfamily enzyme YgiQ (UPF0313 family)
MKIDLYLLDKHVKVQNFVSYPMIDILKVWTKSLGYELRYDRSDEAGVDIDTDADVVAFRAYTHMAPVAYRLGDALKQKGKVVIFGGPHFHTQRTIEEAKPHCNFVVESICFEQWQGLLDDIRKGNILPESREAIHVVDYENKFCFPDNLYEAYAEMKWPHMPLLMSTLGCPYRCEYCNPFLPGKYVLRDIETVYKELSHTNNKLTGFCDATFGLNKKHSIDLMKAIAPLNKYLFVETTMGMLDDEAFLDALALGGTKWLAIGIETLSLPQQKHGRNKVGSNADTIHRIFNNITDRGIMIQANFICGLDCDYPDSFERIYDFYRKSSAGLIYIDVMVPFPTTALYARLEKEGRILDTNWEHYNFHNVVYQPRNMTVDQLIDGYTQLSRELLSSGMLFKKAMQSFNIAGIAGLGMTAWNVALHFDTKKKEKTFMQCKERIRNLDPN